MGWVLWHSRSGHSALPTPHGRLVIQVPAVPLQSSSLLLRLSPCHLHGRNRWSFRLLALAWPGPICCGRFGSELWMKDLSFPHSVILPLK